MIIRPMTEAELLSSNEEAVAMAREHQGSVETPIQYVQNTKNLAKTKELLIAESGDAQVVGKLSGLPPKFFAAHRTFDDQMLFMKALEAYSYTHPADFDAIWDDVAARALDDHRISEKVSLRQAEKNGQFLIRELMDALGENERLSLELATLRAEKNPKEES